MFKILLGWRSDTVAQQHNYFNVDDNLHMTEMSRNNYKNSRAEGTAGYDQDIIGMRRSAEGAIYDSFTNENIFGGDIKEFDWTDKVLAIVIDPGFNHPTGMTYWAVDLSIGEMWQLQERLIDFKIEYIGEKSLDIYTYSFSINFNKTFLQGTLLTVLKVVK